MDILQCCLVKKPVVYWFLKHNLCFACGVRIECFHTNKDKIKFQHECREQFLPDLLASVPQDYVCLTQEHAKELKPVLEQVLNGLDAVIDCESNTPTGKAAKAEKDKIESILISVLSQLQEDH